MLCLFVAACVVLCLKILTVFYEKLVGTYLPRFIVVFYKISLRRSILQLANHLRLAPPLKLFLLFK